MRSRSGTVVVADDGIFISDFVLSEWFGERKRTHKGLDCCGECGSSGGSEREVAQSPVVKWGVGDWEGQRAVLGLGKEQWRMFWVLEEEQWRTWEDKINF